MYLDLLIVFVICTGVGLTEAVGRLGLDRLFGVRQLLTFVTGMMAPGGRREPPGPTPATLSTVS